MLLASRVACISCCLHLRREGVATDPICAAKVGAPATQVWEETMHGVGRREANSTSRLIGLLAFEVTYTLESLQAAYK